MAVKNVDNYTAADGFGLPVNIRRGNPNPLDNSEVWPDVASALDYAKNDPTAYVGQVISYFVRDVNGNDAVRLAQIINEAGDIKPVGAGEEINIEEMSESDIDNIIFAVFGGNQ